MRWYHTVVVKLYDIICRTCVHYLKRIIRGITRTMHLRLTWIFFLGLHLFTQSHLQLKENVLPRSDDTEQTVSIAKGKIKQTRPKWRRQNSERTESFRGFRISASEFSPRGIWGRVKFKPGRRRGNVSEAQPLSTRPVGGVAHIVWQIRETLSSRATVGPFHRQLGKVLCAAWPRATLVSVPNWSRA